ncbi:hypothetical protein CJA_2958 [Cellvibrio japonicus Ueda107]|uniref:Uncharacterized protein n=1 Tax=Cellvibrio japonicus (strain Ueda107) TaxID=498211 RepID=B3PCP8_CELJU|nr:hypothetical protein CJA_2958 [Cellvibrio japonicus Ueda107]
MHTFSAWNNPIPFIFKYKNNFMIQKETFPKGYFP